MVSEVSPNGLGINGNWININTNEVISVRDSIIENGNEMVLITNKGRLSFEDFSQNYIQMSDTDVPEQQDIKIDSKPKVETNEDGIPVFDLIEINNPQNVQQTEKNVVKVQQTEIKSEVKVEENKNFELINKIFETDNIVPGISISIECDKFPVNELAMLKKFFNVTDEDIAEYIKNKFITNKKITDAICKYIASM